MLSSIVLNTYFIALVIIGLFSLEAAFLITSYLQIKKSKKIRAIGEYPVVTIQLPIYNEIYVASRLIKKVCEMDYPRDKLEIQVLDDSTDETADICKKLVDEYLSRGFNIFYMHREKRDGFKAGALKEGLEHAGGDYIAIFDADFLPDINFLKKTIPYFEDKTIGMVQTRWDHLNEEYSILTRMQAFGLSGHFIIEQNGRNNSDLFINFNGTAGIWRKACIIDAGNWQADTLTEDLDLSYRAQMKGWKFLFVQDVVTPSELPVEVNALKSQQYRWTKGSVETALKILPKLWQSGISLKQKIHSTFHLTNNFIYPVILILAVLNLPLVLIKNSLPESKIYFFIFGFFLISFFISFVFYTLSQKSLYQNWIKKVFLFPVYMAGSMGLSVNNSRAVIEALLRYKTPFVRTPKYEINGKKGNYLKTLYRTEINYIVILEIIMAIYSLISVVIAVYYMEFGIIPFMLMFLCGFGFVGYLSIRHYFFN